MKWDEVIEQIEASDYEADEMIEDEKDMCGNRN